MMSEPGHEQIASPAEPLARTAATDPRAAGLNDPPLSVEAIMASVFAAAVALAILFDAAWVSSGKHAICAKWLAKGQADCAGSDGFRDWAPLVVRQGLLLLAVELVLIPALVYGAGLLVRSARRQPGDLPR